jgi:hypothetical protein
MVPISGMLMAKSLRISSRKASNSSSTRSTRRMPGPDRKDAQT